MKGRVEKYVVGITLASVSWLTLLATNAEKRVIRYVSVPMLNATTVEEKGTESGIARSWLARERGQDRQRPKQEPTP
jgi:hypothetical protein